MDVLSYIKSLLPSFKKDRVMEEIQITISEYDNVCIPTYREAINSEKIIKIKSPEVLDFIKTFSRISKIEKSQTIFSTTHAKLLVIRDNLKFFEEILDKELQAQVVSDGLSIMKANILQALEAAYFVSKYSTKLLNVIYIYESAERSEDKQQYIKDNIAPAELDYVKQGFSDFCFVIQGLAKSTNDVKQLLIGLPDITIRADNFAAVNSMFAPNKLDPFNLRAPSRGFTGNPIFKIGMLVAEWQANRYKKNMELKKVLELRLLNLKELNSDNKDAKIEKEIQYLQNRVEAIEYKMSKMEQE